MVYHNIQLVSATLVDAHHKVEVYKNFTTGTHWYVPLYFRSGRWNRYRDRNADINRKSFPAAMNVIQQRSRTTD